MAKKKIESESGQAAIPFEQALEQLQSIVRELESGQLTLDQSLAKYEQGVSHLRRCFDALQQAELKIRQLVDVDDSGNAVTKNFAHSASIEKKQNSRLADGKKDKRDSKDTKDEDKTEADTEADTYDDEHDDEGNDSQSGRSSGSELF